MPANALNPNDLATAIAAALPQAWKDVKGTDFTGNPQDMQPLLLAVSRGLVNYLESYLKTNQANLVATISLSAAGAAPVAYTVTSLGLSISGV